MGMISDEVRHSRCCAESWAAIAGAAARNGVSPRLVAMMHEEAGWYRQHADGLEKWWAVNGAWLDGRRPRTLTAAAVSRLLTVMRPLVSLRPSYRAPAEGHNERRQPVA